MATIKDKDVLVAFLRRMYWIKTEMQYEILARDAYTDILNADYGVIEELFPDEMNRNKFIENMKFS
jgi:hypothetical protein